MSILYVCFPSTPLRTCHYNKENATKMSNKTHQSHTPALRRGQYFPTVSCHRSYLVLHQKHATKNSNKTQEGHTTAHTTATKKGHCESYSKKYKIISRALCVIKNEGMCRHLWRRIMHKVVERKKLMRDLTGSAWKQKRRLNTHTVY